MTNPFRVGDVIKYKRWTIPISPRKKQYFEIIEAEIIGFAKNTEYQESDWIVRHVKNPNYICGITKDQIVSSDSRQTKDIL